MALLKALHCIAATVFLFYAGIYLAMLIVHDNRKRQAPKEPEAPKTTKKLTLRLDEVERYHEDLRRRITDYDKCKTTIEIKRGEKIYLRFDVHSISEGDVEKARDKATTYARSPEGHAVKKNFNTDRFKSHIIYLATDPKDRKVIWENPDVMSEYGILDPSGTIDKILSMTEKRGTFEFIMRHSGMGPDYEPIDLKPKQPEVCRCENCEYCYHSTKDPSIYRCTFFGVLNAIPVKAEDFCSNGTRRRDDHE